MDKARTRRGIPTDMALAERLGRSRAIVSEWRAGTRYPDEDLIVALAEMAGDDPAEWLVAVKAVRGDGKAGKVWAALAKRLGATAALVLCAIGFSGAMPGKSYAASVSQTSATSMHGAMPIMSNRVPRDWSWWALVVRMEHAQAQVLDLPNVDDS
jgi:hypothetical protein